VTMNRLPVFLVFTSLFLALAFVSYRALNFIFHGNILAGSIFGTLVLVAIFGLFNTFNQFSSTKRSTGTNLIIGFALSMFISILFFSLTLLIRDLVTGLLGLFLWDRNTGINVKYWSTWGMFLLSLFPFMSMLYGITRGKYNFTVSNVKVKIKNLPKAFHGFKVAQISDIHSGTFDSVKQVEKGINLINEQQPDLFVFTGDLVNFHKDEIDPYIDTFAKIKAPFGKYSILGNHDYYGIANVPTAERANYWPAFARKHKQIGFDLLRNENRKIEKDGASINLIGVENWGTGGFPQTGDLSQAMRGIDDSKPSILMSHDPSHWEHVVLKTKHLIDITLSGHTHAMQFGINTRWLKWSPVKYRYKRWMGLYEEEGRKLYVNRGFGFLGFPGRVFMWPEITILELVPSV